MSTTLQFSSASLLLSASASALLMAAPMAAQAQVGNTATGTDALSNNTTGDYNTADGYQALFSNTTGSYNTADGYQALFKNNTGLANTADGYQSLGKNTSGSFNTATGVSSLYLNTTGSYNTAYGYQTLFNTTGINNIAVGLSAGFYNTTGSNNIDIGNYGSSADSGVIRIGTPGTQSRTFIAGISGVLTTGGVGVFINSSGQLGTVTSSKRFKKNIHSIGSVGDKLLRLRPVSFRYKQAAENGIQPVQYGLIAEEVAKVFPELVQYDKEGKPFTVYYHLLTPLLLSELQKEHHQNVSQQAKLTQHQAELSAFKHRDAKQQAELASLKQQFVAQQQQQSTQLAALQLKLNQLDRVVQASNSEIRLSQK